MTRPREPSRVELRLRIADWLRFGIKKWEIDKRRMAELLGSTEATVGRIANGRATPGLDFVVKMRLYLGFDFDRMIHQDPPWQTLEGQKSGPEGPKSGLTRR